MSQLLSIRQYAKERGVSHTAVNKAVHAGRIQLVDGKIDPAAADRDWLANTRARSGGAPPAPPQQAIPPMPPPIPPRGEIGDKPSAATPPPPGSLAHAQLVKETARAKKAALEAQRMEGKLVDAQEVVQAWAAHIQTAKNRALMLPPSLAPKLALESDAAACEQLLQSAIDAMLHELSEYRPHA